MFVYIYRQKQKHKKKNVFKSNFKISEFSVVSGILINWGGG